MSKKYNRLWVFGDSYATPNSSVKSQDSFWGLAAKHLGIPEVINASWPCNSFGSVWHMLIGMQQQFDFTQDYFIIGIPPLERLTVFDNYKDTRWHAQYINTDTWAVSKKQINCHTGLMNIHGHEAGKMIIYEDRAWTETQTLSIIFLLTTWLDSMSANYLIVNLSKPFDSNNVWGPTEFTLPYCLNHDRCILFKDTYYSVNVNLNKPVDFAENGWYGHHGSEGNKHFFEISVKDRLC